MSAEEKELVAKKRKRRDHRVGGILAKRAHDLRLLLRILEYLIRITFPVLQLHQFASKQLLEAHESGKELL